jgi:hypothetical protein
MLLVFMDFGDVSGVPLATVGKARMQGVGTELGTVALGTGIPLLGLLERTGRSARRSREKKRALPCLGLRGRRTCGSRPDGLVS